MVYVMGLKTTPKIVLDPKVKEISSDVTLEPCIFPDHVIRPGKIYPSYTLFFLVKYLGQGNLLSLRYVQQAICTSTRGCSNHPAQRADPLIHLTVGVGHENVGAPFPITTAAWNSQRYREGMTLQHTGIHHT